MKHFLSISFVAVLLFNTIRTEDADTQCYVTQPSLDNVIRPCPNMGMSCIRSHFQNSGECHQRKSEDCSHHANCTRIYIDTIKSISPFWSTSFTQTDVVVTLCDVKAEEFYVNPITNVTVLTLNYGTMQVDSTFQVDIRISGREPVFAKIKRASEKYVNVKSTTTIPDIASPKLRCSSTFAATPVNVVSLTNGLECYGKFTGKSEEGLEATIREKLDEMFSDQNITTIIPDGFLYRMPIITISYIQKYICDYGITESESRYLY